MGIDEAGRGPWAGPVVAAAVRLDPARVPEGLDDSKRLSPARRAALDAQIRAAADCAVAEASVAEIDALGIGRATMLAMRRAADALGGPAIVDGRALPEGVAGMPLVRGDARSQSVAAASILAKHARDAAMVTLAQRFPAYGWDRNKGYGTQAHRTALESHGPTQHHRRSFRPIREMLCP